MEERNLNRNIILYEAKTEADIRRFRAERVVTYGLSHRDTLTLSSLGEMPVLCLQRALTPEAGPELDARELPLTAEKLLLLYGLWLLG